MLSETIKSILKSNGQILDRWVGEPLLLGGDTIWIWWASLPAYMDHQHLKIY